MDDVERDKAIKEALDDFATFAADALRAAQTGDIVNAAVAEENAKITLERIERLTEGYSK